MFSAMIIKSSAYSISQGKVLLHFFKSASRTISNSKRRYTEPWWTPIFTSNLSHKVLFTLITLLLFLYIVITALIDHSSTPNFLITHLTTSLGTRSNAFSRSTEAKESFFFFSRYLSCSWRAIKIASIEPLPGMKPNCIASMSTSSRMFCSITLSDTFIICSNNLNHL